MTETWGLVTIGGVLVCLLGIGLSAVAGTAKERELSAGEKKATIQEFNLVKGIWVAVFAGVMSACMKFGFVAGEPIATLAKESGTADVWQNNPVFVVVLAGGFTTNCVWCLILNLWNKTGGDYANAKGASLAANYLFAALAGTTWYFQFFFYGMGMTQMGKDFMFSSWTIHMAFIIVFSTLWGLYFREWKGTSRRTHRLIFSGIGVLILSTVVVGVGSYLTPQHEEAEKDAEPPAAVESIEPPSQPGGGPPDPGGDPIGPGSAPTESSRLRNAPRSPALSAARTRFRLPPRYVFSKPGVAGCPP